MALHETRDGVLLTFPAPTVIPIKNGEKMDVPAIKRFFSVVTPDATPEICSETCLPTETSFRDYSAYWHLDTLPKPTFFVFATAHPTNVATGEIFVGDKYKTYFLNGP